MKKNKLAEEDHTITTKIKKNQEEGKRIEAEKKEKKINKIVQSRREQRIKDISEQIKKTAENGDSYIRISALWSDSVEMRLYHIIQKWANEQGFELDSSYNEIYEPPHCSDDLPSDTRSFLTISWE